MDREARRNSHFLFTLHLHQERADKSNKAAGECEHRTPICLVRLQLPGCTSLTAGQSQGTVLIQTQMRLMENQMESMQVLLPQNEISPPGGSALVRLLYVSKHVAAK